MLRGSTTTNGTFSGRLTDVDELNIGNPLALTGEDVPELDKYRFNLNLRPSYQITDRLEVAALFGISYDKENENLFIPDYGVSNEPLYTDRGEIYETALNEVRNFMARADIHVCRWLFGMADSEGLAA